MERTPQEMPLQLTPNPLKNLVFLKEVFQLGVSISSQPRYDRFDTAACLIVVSELTKQFGKRREFMERTPQEMLLQLTPNPLKNQAFLKEAFQLGV